MNEKNECPLTRSSSPDLDFFRFLTLRPLSLLPSAHAVTCSLPVSPSGCIAPAGSRRSRHEVALQGLWALFPEAQQRGRVPRVRKEGRGAEILHHEAAFHRAELCETGTGKLLLISFACL